MDKHGADRPGCWFDEFAPQRSRSTQRLSEREWQAAVLSARGLTVDKIALHMQVAPGTVKTLLARARQKLGCRNVRELSAMLLRHGAIRPEDLLLPDDKPSDASPPPAVNQKLTEKSTNG